jgi:molybdopterin-containing oxidoreductase family iron-sulfur binding subunit
LRGKNISGLKDHQDPKMEKKYWKGVEELQNDAEFVRLKNNEFYENLPLDEVIGKKAEESNLTPRRDFLKFLGFGVAAASLAACEAPVRKTIPYLIRPEQIVPGIANYYASTYFDGYDYASLLVKTREGRPIKIEGNPLSSVTKGKVSARVQASVLSLYDNARLRGPMMNGNAAPWTNIDKAITDKLTAIAAAGGKIRILSSTVISPSTLKVIEDFSKKYPTTRHIQYDAISCSAMIQANKESFGVSVLPTYSFNKANVIVAFDCDFLLNWISPVEYASQYAETRKLNSGRKEMSKHYQFESALSLTGSNADVRTGIKPSQQLSYIIALHNAIASKAGAKSAGSATADGKVIEKLAEELWSNKGKSLVVCGINDASAQKLVNSINSMLGNYGSTIDLDNASNLRKGNDADLAMLLEEADKGEVAALFVYNCNPVYTLPNGKAFAKSMNRIDLSVSFADRADETASVCKFICPDNHPLESWSDAEPRKGVYSTGQPTISPLFDTRQMQESLLAWAGTPAVFHDYMAANWKAWAPEATWDKIIQDGVYEKTASSPSSYSFNADVSGVSESKSAGAIEVVVYEKAGVGNGAQANNPWLQELPDPVSKITWDNYLAVSPKDAREKGFRQGNIVTVKTAKAAVNVPVLIQPGQTPGTVSIALGYGRTKAGKTADNIGWNAYPLVSMVNGLLSYSATAEILKTADEDYVFAATQSHHTMMGRAIVKETSLEEYKKNPNAGNEEELFEVKVGKEISKKPANEVTLWDEHELGNHHWGMSIDLNSCIGCGACVVACTAENNVPMVGKDEVMRSREMHWMRIDRYYSSDFDPKEGEKGDVKLMENPSDMPRVVFQPVMCQHCNHAPCETVCPVIATSHSSEGLNQMIYNRCVGTRYCANNCPYKVRRFNWFRYSDNPKFDYNMNNDLGKMVLNPDVVVRSRGVMEKCSMCVQRIQETKLNAKKAGRKIKDGEFNVACAQTCPTNAITFGDYNIPDSKINQMWKPKERSYHLLEELNVQPNVFYQTKVRNIEESREA